MAAIQPSDASASFFHPNQDAPGASWHDGRKHFVYDITVTSGQNVTFNTSWDGTAVARTPRFAVYSSESGKHCSASGFSNGTLTIAAADDAANPTSMSAVLHVWAADFFYPTGGTITSLTPRTTTAHPDATTNNRPLSSYLGLRHRIFRFLQAADEDTFAFSPGVLDYATQVNSNVGHETRYNAATGLFTFWCPLSDIDINLHVWSSS